jgi:mannose-6-phosphate isomerase-like protein (cupin superfamily)
MGASRAVTVLRLRDGERWLDKAPAWSTWSAAGWFSLAKAGHRFDRHFHDCAEYWAIVEGRARVAVGAEMFDVGPGDLVCTPAGVEHDIVAAHTEEVMLLFIEDVVPPGGTAGHRHADPTTAWHQVPVRLIDVLSRLRCWLEDRVDVIDRIELPGGDADHQVVGSVVAEGQAAAVEAVESDDRGER